MASTQTQATACPEPKYMEVLRRIPWSQLVTGLCVGIVVLIPRMIVAGPDSAVDQSLPLIRTEVTSSTVDVNRTKSTITVRLGDSTSTEEKYHQVTKSRSASSKE